MVISTEHGQAGTMGFAASHYDEPVLLAKNVGESNPMKGCFYFTKSTESLKKMQEYLNLGDRKSRANSKFYICKGASGLQLILRRSGMVDGHVKTLALHRLQGVDGLGTVESQSRKRKMSCSVEENVKKGLKAAERHQSAITPTATSEKPPTSFATSTNSLERRMPGTPTGTSYKPLLPATPTGTSYKPILPATSTGTSYKPLLPATPTGTSYKPILPATSTGTSNKPILPATTTDTSYKPILSATPTDTSNKPILPATPTDTSYKPILSATSTDAFKQLVLGGRYASPEYSPDKIEVHIYMDNIGQRLVDLFILPYGCQKESISRARGIALGTVLHFNPKAGEVREIFGRQLKLENLKITSNTQGGLELSFPIVNSRERFPVDLHRIE